MQPIPQPHILDADRLVIDRRGEFLVDHETRANMLDKALHESCAYAEQLWQTLDNVRTYLSDCLPPDPHLAGTADIRLGAHPYGPDDEQGWTEWTAAFAAVTSVLCGPHGDSGYGMSEAQVAARMRRSVPAGIAAAQAQDQPAAGSAAAPAAGSAPAAGVAGSPSAGTRAGPPAPSRSDWPKTLGLVALAALAVRGLLPRRRGGPALG